MMFENCFSNKKVLITGNTGFKGSWLSSWLLKLGAKVYGLSNEIPTDPSLYEILSLKNKIKHYDADVRNLDRIKEIFQEVAPDFIFHLAAQSIVSKSYEDPISTISTNVIGTSTVLEALRKLKNDFIVMFYYYERFFFK